MEYYSVLLPLALIMGGSKILSKLCEKLNLPQVVGMLLTGVIIGFINYIPNQQILTETSMEGIGFIAKLGVILIMFSAGLETDIKQIKSVGAPAMVITLAGVAVPMGLGFVVACLFNGGFNSGYETMLDNLIKRYGFENDKVIEFAQVIERTPHNWLWDKIVLTIYKEYMSTSE